MEIVHLPQNLKVFGVLVKDFPMGIGEAFDELISKLPQGDKRPYYGISECTPEGITYKAAALETFAGEGSNYGYETYTVEGGDYLAKTVWDWQPKTTTIKDVFAGMLKHDRAHQAKPCVEIYKDDNEMLCLVKLVEEPLSAQLAGTMNDLSQVLSSFEEEELNSVPFEGSWTPGQVGDHVRKSIKGMLQLVNGPSQTTQRAPDAFIEQISKDLLDFTIKFTSPDFIIPENKQFDKERLLTSLSDLGDETIELSKTLDLKKTCTAFPFPVYGELTRLEVLHFMLCHTKRHIHQLQKIKAVMTKGEPIT